MSINQFNAKNGLSVGSPTIVSVVSSAGAITAPSVSSTVVSAGIIHSIQDAILSGITVGRGTGYGTGNIALGSSIYGAGASASSWNIGIGSSALTSLTTGTYNIALGAQTLFNATTGTHNFAAASGSQYNMRGSDNIAIGRDSMRGSATPENNTASDCIAIGKFALSSISSGIQNIAIGSYALNLNSSGQNNVAYGYHSLKENLAGSENTAIGSNALTFNTNSNNTAIGSCALAFNTGSDNTATGYNALCFNDVGSYNVANGSNALYSNWEGSYNVCLGYQAGYNLTTGSNNIIIGAGNGTALNTLYPTSSNYISIGNAIFAIDASGTGTTAAGNVMIGSSSQTVGQERFQVTGNMSVNSGTLKVFDSGGPNVFEAIRSGVAQIGIDATTQFFMNTAAGPLYFGNFMNPAGNFAGYSMPGTYVFGIHTDTLNVVIGQSATETAGQERLQVLGNGYFQGYLMAGDYCKILQIDAGGSVSYSNAFATSGGWGGAFTQEGAYVFGWVAGNKNVLIGSPTETAGQEKLQVTGTASISSSLIAGSVSATTYYNLPSTAHSHSGLLPSNGTVGQMLVNNSSGSGDWSNTINSLTVTGNTAVSGVLSLKAAPTETLVAKGTIVGSTASLDVSTGSIFTATVTGAVTWSITGSSAGAASVTLILTNGGLGAQTFTGFLKSGGAALSFSTAGTDILELMTPNGWTTKYIFMSGKGMA